MRNEKFAKRLGATRHAYQTATAEACVTGADKLMLCSAQDDPRGMRGVTNREGQHSHTLSSTIKMP